LYLLTGDLFWLVVLLWLVILFLLSVDFVPAAVLLVVVSLLLELFELAEVIAPVRERESVFRAFVTPVVPRVFVLVALVVPLVLLTLGSVRVAP